VPAKITHQQFIEKANNIHNNKYEYPDIYINSDTKINIVCPLHGRFMQVPYSHLNGNGCPKCANDLCAQLFSKKHDDFVIKANLIHNNKYEYLEIYKNAHTKIEIECPIHKIFIQSPDKHLQGNGCPKCAGRIRKTKEQFVLEANLVHNNLYKYPGNYINARTDIAIECSKHGLFYQVPDVHLNGCGCPTCSYNSSKPEMQWLDSLNIPNDNTHRHCRIYVNNSYIKPDGYDPTTNTIYEFYGDFWHGNPKIYKPQDVNVKNNKTFGDLYIETLNKEEIIKSAGYNLVFIWESDWKNKLK
jgi:hypothetical protein